MAGSQRDPPTFGRAREEARRLGNAFIGTEHVLLALLAVPGERLGRVFDRLGVDRDRLRSDVLGQVERGTGPVPDGQLPITPRLKQVLEATLVEAGSLGRAPIDLELLFLGLVAVVDGVAGRALAGAGVSLEEARREVALAAPEAGGDAPARS